MEKKKVLVTGANGYIGRHVVEHLLSKGCEVYGSDVCFDGLDERVHRVESPIFNNPDIFKESGCPDVCIHMAWRDGFVHNAESHIEDLSNHYSFIKNMIEGGLKQIAVMGTMHEVGYWEGAIDESTPTNPSSKYGIAKDALRNLTKLLATSSNVCWQWLRAYYIYGDDLRGNSIFGKITKAEMEGKETFPFTSGKNKFDFITVEQLAEQIACSALQTEVDGIINCCTGEPLSLGEMIESFIKSHGFKIRLAYGEYPDRPYDSPGVWGDATKIRQIMKN